jgi:ribosomal protein S18 acetylase RimI-like enzyme
VGELESLAVLPPHRRKGIGGALLEAADVEFARLGVRNQILGMLPDNTAALRLYQRHGYQSTWLYLSRFNSR